MDGWGSRAWCESLNFALIFNLKIYNKFFVAIFTLCVYLNAQSIALTLGNESQAESAGTVTETYTVSDYSADFTIILTIDTDNSTGSSGSDYSSTLIESYGDANDGRIPVTGNGAYTVQYTLIDDNVDEENETFKIQQTNTGGIASATKTVTITDNDDAPTMQFAAATDTDGENTWAYYVTVSLSHASSRSTLPAYTISISGSSTATGAGTDYNALNPTTYTFNSGSTTDNFYVTVVDDALDEVDETIIFSIASNNNTYASVSGNTTHTVTITDNDAAPTIGFNASAANAVETNSGNDDKTAQVDISAASAKAISANYTITGTATGSGTDHDLAAGTVSISAGNTNNTIGWNVIGEALYEENETIIITLSDPTNATLSSDVVHTYTITNDDSAPTIAFTSTSQSNNEATTAYDVGVTLSTASGINATMDYAVSGTSTATGSGTDYTLANGTATITAGNTTTSFETIIVNDALYENDETIVIGASTPTGSSLGANTTFTYTIANNAAGSNDAKPTIQFNSATGTAAESTTSFNIQLDLSAASGLTSTVDYALTAGDPAATGTGTDYTLANGTATIAAGATTANLATTVVNDALDENNEIFIVTISNPNANVALGNNTTHTYTIQDNDDPPTVQFNATSSSETEGTNGTLQVDLSAASAKDVTVNYAVQAASTGTGGGTDYTLADGTLTISAGSTTGNITVTGADDALDEDDETVVVLLSSPGNSSLGTNTTHTFTITDNDATPTIQFNATSSSKSEGTTDHTIQVDISAAAGRDISVAFTVAAGTPAATGSATDYTLADGTLTITGNNGNTSNTIDFTMVDDALDEWGEQFVVTLSNSPTNATIGTNTTHTLTITDNDAEPTIDFALATGSVAENVTPTTITANLSAASGKDIAVYYAITAGSPAATGSGTDYTLASDSLEITAGSTSGTISAVIVDDALDENNEQVVVTLSGVGDNVTIGSTTPAHTLTITDNDDPPTIAFSAVNSAGNEAVTPVTMTAQLSGASGLDITADYAVTGTASGNNVDYTLADGTVSITAGNTTSTVSATIIDDEVVEDDETVIVTLSNPSNATVGANSAYTYTITNDDSPPADFKVDTVIATGGTVRFRYWNSTNTGLRIDVPVENSDAVVGGEIQIRAKKGILEYENLSSPYTILSADKGTTVQMTATATEFEAITGFAEDSIITITAIIKDQYGNTTTGTASDYTTTIDQTVPSDFTLGTVTVTGGTVVTDYWNSTNTGVSAVVPITNTDTDPTLTDGTVQLQARSGSAGSWTTVGSAASITAAEATAQTKTITASATGTANVMDIEEIPAGSGAEVADGKEFFFRVIMTDVAGNATNSTQSTSSPLQDQTVPTFTSISSSNDNKAFKQGDTILVTITMNEIVNVSLIPKLTMETGTSDGTAAYSSGTGSANLVFTYIVASGHTSNDLGYITSSAFSLDSGTIRDVAGNDLNITTLPTAGAANSLSDNKSIVIDTKLHSVNLTFDDPDTLVRFEDGTLNITATFSDSIQVDSIPKITIDFPGVSTGDITAANMNRTSGTIYNYPLTIIDGSTGIITVTISAYDKALNILPADSVFRGTAVTIDNTDPSAFTTGTITAMGDTIVVPWLNKETDSLRLLIPISATDESLLDGGDVNVQMRISGKMTADTWLTIATSDASSPSAPADSIKQLSGNQTFFRTKEDIITSFTPLGLVQGDTIRIRGSINDKVGNITYGTQSESFFVLDTLPPAQRPFFGDTLFTSNNVTSILTVNRDTLWANDTIRFAFNNWVDSVKTNEKSSGINKYEYALYQSTKATPDDTNPNDWTKFRDYRSISLDTVNTDTFALTHNLKYYVALKAVDIAGNTSDTLNTFRTLRHNAYPVIDSIADTTAKEDVLWEQLLTVNDKDLVTLRSDQFTYALTTMKLDTTASPIDSTVVTGLAADVSTSGKVTFTPTKLDTADYVFRVIVTDNWALLDTIDIDIKAEAVNDPPIINLSSITKLSFLEGANSDSINLTRYSYDEDNDTTDLKYTFRIASTLPAKGGFPTAKFGFLSDFSQEYKNSFITKLVDEFPASTIIQKNNAFVIYSASVDQFIDPLKVDSLAIGDSVFSWITPTDTASADTNYYTSSDMLVEFTVTDPDGLTGKDTVTFFINPINDPPVWSGVPDTTILENDSLYFDFANYLTDVDDSTLTISILPLKFGDNISIVPTKTFETKASGIEYSSNAHIDTVKFKPDTLWFGPSGPWVTNKTDSTLIQITAADGDTSAIDTFVVKVQRVPRPEIRMYVVQNNAFTNYYEIFLIDSVSKTKDLTLKVQSKAVTLDTAAAFTYVGHYNFKTKGTYTFEVAANGVVGDTVITQNLGLALAKMYGTWSGKSADGQFNVIGRNGAVDFDQSIMILDSTLFEPYFNDRASYLLGNEAFRFKKSVEISMPGQDEEMALYQRTTGTGWVELPSLTQGNRVMAYTEKMGYFRMGPKTLIVPGQTALQQNYPNPFNPVTTIEYDLGFIDGPFQKVTLTVYDILGRNVKTLVNTQQGIGRYRLKWNGKDQNGVPVSSGIYFVHLLTNMGRSQTKKVMLMR